jgi:hypothetical protein
VRGVAGDPSGPADRPDVLVVTEVVYLLGARLGVSAETVSSGHGLRAFDVEPVHPADRLRVAGLVNRCRDLPLGTVDASVAACAERLGVDEIACPSPSRGSLPGLHDFFTRAAGRGRGWSIRSWP